MLLCNTLVFANQSRQTPGRRQWNCVLVFGWMLFLSSGNAFGQSGTIAGNPAFTGGPTTAQLNNILYLDGVVYACSSVGINSAYTALPSTGGTIDGRGCATITLSANPFAGVTKPLALWLGDVAVTVAAGVIVDLSGVSNISIFGNGHNRTVFKFSNAGAVDGFKIASQQIQLSGFTVNMQSTGTGAAFHFLGLLDGRFGDLEAKNSGSQNFFFDGVPSGAGKARGDFFNVLSTGAASDGWYVKENNAACTDGFDVMHVWHIESNDNGRDGIRHENTGAGVCDHNWDYIQTRTENNAGDGIHVVNYGGIRIQGAESEGNTGWGVNLDATSVDVSIWGIGFSGNAAGTINRLGQREFVWQLGGAYPQWSGLQILSDRPAAQPTFIRGAAGQTGDLLQIQSSSAVVQNVIDANGKLTGGTQPWTFRSGAPTAGQPSIVAELILGQTAPLQTWQNHAGTIFSQITHDGHLRLGGGISTAAPTAGNTGFQHIRVAGCATTTTQFSICDVTVTWTAAFADTNYTVVCTGEGLTSGQPAIGASGAGKAKSGASTSIRTVNLIAGIASQFTTIDCTAVHD